MNDFLTIEQAWRLAAEHGLKLTPRAISKAANMGKISGATKLGGRDWFLPEKGVTTWISDRTMHKFGPSSKHWWLIVNAKGQYWTLIDWADKSYAAQFRFDEAVEQSSKLAGSRLESLNGEATIREAAWLVGKSSQTIRRWVAQKKLRAKVKNGQTIIRQTDLESLSSKT